MFVLASSINPFTASTLTGTLASGGAPSILRFSAVLTDGSIGPKVACLEL